MEIEPSTTADADSGRDRHGRFAAGNGFAIGNPLAAKVARFRALIAESVSDDDLREIIRTLVERAKAGDFRAITELLNRLLGKVGVAHPEGSAAPEEHEAVAAFRAFHQEGLATVTQPAEQQRE